MIRVAYKVVFRTFEEADTPEDWVPRTEQLPDIIEVPVTDLEGVSWREAKAKLRKMYLNKAASLRHQTEKDWFPR